MVAQRFEGSLFGVGRVVGVVGFREPMSSP